VECSPGVPSFSLLSHGKAGQTVISSLLVDADADHRLGGRAGGAQHSNRRESLIVEFRDQEGLSSIDFSPYLADLDALSCHH